MTSVLAGDRRTQQSFVAVDLETTDLDPDTERIVEIGAVRVLLLEDGAVELGERFSTFVDPGRALSPSLMRLTGIRDKDLVGAPRDKDAVALFSEFAGDAVLLGHNVGFDLAFLQRSGFGSGASRLDTIDLASIIRPGAPSYALQSLAADAGVSVIAAHRALDDALTSAGVLGALARLVRLVPIPILEELSVASRALGAPAAQFFEDALAFAVKQSWLAPVSAARPRLPARRRDAQKSAALGAHRVFAVDGPLAGGFEGFEDRPEQRELALAVERTFAAGGVLVAEAGTGVGKSLAYLAPAFARALLGERTIVSTHALPLQDQLVRKDVPALQASLGTSVPVAVLKGRGNYLCPRRWQQFRTEAQEPQETRLALKVLVWRSMTVAGDRAELNLLGPESGLWPRLSADDEGCTARRCATVGGGCYLERARQDAEAADVVVVNHALLLQDARAGNSILPEAEHLVIDEAHRLEDVAADAFGHRLLSWRLRRDLDRVGRAPLVTAALRSGEQHRVEAAEALRAEVARTRPLAEETFQALGGLLTADAGSRRLRITSGFRATDERWLPIELAAERLGDGLAGIRTLGSRLSDSGGEDDEISELAGGLRELVSAQSAIRHGIHDPRHSEVVWVEAARDGSPALHVAPSHVGDSIRSLVVDRHRSVVFTSATLAVAGLLAFAEERFGVADVADGLRVGSPFNYALHATLLIPTDSALPGEDGYAIELAEVVTEIGRALGGRTLVLFTSHAAMRDVSGRLLGLAESGIVVLTQGVDGSRRSLLERFAAGNTVLLGTQSFWEGVDLPGDQLRCVVIARLPFEVPDDPLVQGRAERYEDPFSEYQVPQAALRLRQGAGRLIRTATDRGAIVLMDRRVLTRDYGPTMLASLPPATLQRVNLDSIASVVSEWCRAGPS